MLQLLSGAGAAQCDLDSERRWPANGERSAGVDDDPALRGSGDEIGGAPLPGKLDPDLQRSRMRLVAEIAEGLLPARYERPPRCCRPQK